MPFVYIVACVGALGGMLFGYDTGAISGALLYLKQHFALSSALQEVVTSIALAGAAVGAAIGGPLADRYGRRGVIIANAAMFVAGSLATAFAQNVPWLIAGRLFIGAAIGIASFVAPLYLCEIAPARIRGALVSLNQVALTVRHPHLLSGRLRLRPSRRLALDVRARHRAGSWRSASASC